jgi:7-keto-8-aminopelargonate synthetase-like enzyme
MHLKSTTPVSRSGRIGVHMTIVKSLKANQSMTNLNKYRFSSARTIDLVNRLMGAAEAKGVMMCIAARYEGRRLEFEDRMLYNFGSCSYLGLEIRQELRQAAAAATYEYGTQFSFSRAYLECALYKELEANLEIITGRPVLVAPSTTLAHLAALPVLIRDKDAVLIDQFAHASLHQATQTLSEVPIRLVHHANTKELAQLVKTQSATHERIWLIMDGLYSMFGDFAPFNELVDLLQIHPQLHLYVDDAHSTSWTGTHGRGAALTHLGRYDRVIVALSLNKAFSCAGGALVLSSPELKARIRRCGGPMLFSGPIPPPMLGAAVASSQLHLAPEHVALQHNLMRRIDHAIFAAEEARLPLANRHRTPIFFLTCNSTDECTAAVLELRKQGFFVCPSAFPAVPLNQPGVRFTISLHNSLEDIDAFIAAAKKVFRGRPPSSAC